MKLEELRKRLYKKTPRFEERPEESLEYRPGAAEGARLEETEEWEHLPEKINGSLGRKKLLLKIGLLALIGVVATTALAMYIKGRRAFSKKDIKIEISGPAEVMSGKEAEFEVNFTNNSKMAIRDAELVFQCPEYAENIKDAALIKEISINSIGAGEANKRKFDCRIIGEEDSSRIVQARLDYKPDKLGSRFENSSTFSVAISSLPVSVEVETPPQILGGGRVDYLISYKNISEDSFLNFRLKVKYPSGFSFSSSDPPASEFNDTWDIRELRIDDRGEIKISGKLGGSEGETKQIEVLWGTVERNDFIKYAVEKSVSRISSAPLVLSLSVNNSSNYTANLGDELDYNIFYKNNADVGLEELILKTRFEGEMYDFSTLKTEKGSFDEANRVITWSATSNPDFLVLAPSQEGSINFKIKLKDRFPISSSYDKNYKVKILSDIETPTVPFGFAEEKVSALNELETKINTRLVINSKGYYYDTTSGIVNSGPLPPKVGETTTYTIHWELVNLSNDANSVQVKSTLPQGVEWMGKFSVSHGQEGFSYNSRTKQIVWNIGDMPATVGVALPVYRAVFQVSITPSIVQLGQLAGLISESMVTGADNFTGVSLAGSDSAISTDLPDDVRAGREDGRVVE